ncbi:MAG: DNA polymerase III subunit beta [Deltaproteobacteria bacterium]|nr:DNA polymerase III subunit beta [Deltaproteobacteria bacterium]
MEIRIAQETFSALLGRAQSVIERKSTRAILENILLEAYDGSIRISATDLRIALTQETPCLVGTPGAVAVSARKLHEVVRELPKAEVSVEVKENQWVTVRCGKITFHLPGMPAEDYPSMPPLPDTFLSFPSIVFRRMIEKTLFAASNDESRIFLTGVFLKEWVDEKNEAFLRMVSTDGHRLAMVDRPLPVTPGVFQVGVIIPKKGLGEFRTLLEPLDGDFELAASEGRLYARVANTCLSVTLIDSSFPNYEQVIPSEVKTWVRINRVSLLNALRRVSLLSDEETRTVVMEATEDSVVLTSDNPRFGDAREELEVEYRQSPVRIAFNAGYFLEILRVMDGEDISLGITDGLAPCVVRDAQDARYLSVIMPMRIE